MPINSRFSRFPLEGCKGQPFARLKEALMIYYRADSNKYVDTSKTFTFGKLAPTFCSILPAIAMDEAVTKILNNAARQKLESFAVSMGVDADGHTKIYGLTDMGKNNLCGKYYDSNIPESDGAKETNDVNRKRKHSLIGSDDAASGKGGAEDVSGLRLLCAAIDVIETTP